MWATLKVNWFYGGTRFFSVAMIFTSLLTGRSNGTSQLRNVRSHKVKQKSVCDKGLSNYVLNIQYMEKIEDILGRLQTRLIDFPYQGESGDGKHHFEPTVDKERAEQPQPVVPQVFERQLEDVSPADAAEVDLLRRPVRCAAQRQELCVKKKKKTAVRWVVDVNSRHASRLCRGQRGRSYNDHGEEAKAHEDVLHFDEQHGAGQLLQHGGVKAWD